MSPDMPDDPRKVLEWLVPEGGERRKRAEQVLAFTRALSGTRRETNALLPQEVEREFESEARVRAGGALEDLLVHHLREEYAGRSFLPLPTPRAGVQAAWDALATLRESLKGLPGVPGPGERALAVAGRLLEGLYRLSWDSAALELWRARLEHAAQGARAGEAAFRARLSETPARGVGSRTFAALLAGLLASLLDRGDLRDAIALLEEHRAEACMTEDRDLRRMRFWTRLFVGDLAGARALRESSELGGAFWPNAFAQLRDEWKDARELLEGLEPLATSVGRANESSRPGRSRSDHGAAVLAVFAFGPGRCVDALEVNVAPALRAKLEPWLREREGACCVRTLPEHGLVIEAVMQRLHGVRPPSCLGSRSVALALIPVLDEQGEVAGWVHLEFEHHLVPDRAQLAALTDTWRLAILRRAVGVRAQTLHLTDRVSEVRSSAESWRPPDASVRLAQCLDGVAGRLCAETFQALASVLGVKLRQRRWWGFTHARGETNFVTSGGEGLEDVQGAPGGARALDRCLAAGGVVSFDEPDAGLSIHGRSGSGFVLPLLDGGRTVGLFAIESERRRDFQTLDHEEIAKLVREFVLPLTMARFRAWHVEHFGIDLYFDTAQPAFREFSQRVFAAARSSSPLMLSGPIGAGKRSIARWLHWCAGADHAHLEIFRAQFDSSDVERRRWFLERLQRPDRRLLIEGVEDLPGDLQEELQRALDEKAMAAQAKAAGLLIATTSTSLAECVERGALRSDLAARLDRFQVFVPALIDRRQDIPGLARFFAARFAAEEGCSPPHFDDEALATLWRQAWPGNLRDLEATIFKLVVLHPGEVLGQRELQAMARRFKIELKEKLPPRRPRRRDLVQALRSTLTSTGRCNKRRAAAYLGWDPDTLVLRIRECDLKPTRLEAEPDTWVS